MTGRRRRRRKQLLDDFKEKRGYCKLKEEAVARTVWRTWFGRGCGPVVRQTVGWMNCVIFVFYVTDLWRNSDKNLWASWKWARRQRRFSCGHKINKVDTCPVKPVGTRQVKNALVESVNYAGESAICIIPTNGGVFNSSSCFFLVFLSINGHVKCPSLSIFHAIPRKYTDSTLMWISEFFQVFAACYWGFLSGWRGGNWELRSSGLLRSE